MGHLKRFFWVVGWLSVNLLRRLSANRRLLLLLALFLFLFRVRIDKPTYQLDLDTSRLAFVPVMLVLMLELKDKLLARDEIEVARQVQLSLLPRKHPEIAGWQVFGVTTAANDVGGDLIDYLDGADGRTGLALGDVAGKGMGAALLCAKLQATLRALAPEASDLAQLGARLNGVLERAGLDNRYATLFYCEIEAGRPEVRYLNAGHNPALLVRGRSILALGASSLPLGMLPAASYVQGSALLDAGDRLVLYSDGITEAASASGEEYGTERLRRIVLDHASRSAEELARRVLADVSAFVGGEKPHDDQSILVLGRAP
ncbi:MAG TPA: PP2C family protein-serine/threonine phosphatase [Candidatus Polarisedimenticolaceae bacterium]|nr:PP2C family protein-serine/threonine phosphatase [Candidatus Polarisedimenticolaceae bacterium]